MAKVLGPRGVRMGGSSSVSRHTITGNVSEKGHGDGDDGGVSGENLLVGVGDGVRYAS